MQSKQTAPNPLVIRCQKCLQYGHWTYTCKGKRKITMPESASKRLANVLSAPQSQSNYEQPKRVVDIKTIDSSSDSESDSSTSSTSSSSSSSSSSSESSDSHASDSDTEEDNKEE